MCRLLGLLAMLSILVTAPEASSAETDVWTNIGPEGGTINTVAVDPQNPSTVYAASWAGGIYKSTNAGSTWVRSGHTGIALAVFIDPKNPTTLYSVGNGLFKTSDGGTSWNQIYRDTVWGLTIDPQNPNNLYASTYAGLLKPSYRGYNWT